MQYIRISCKEELLSYIDEINETRSYVVLDVECDPPSLEHLDDAKNPHKARLVDIQLSGAKHKEVLIFPAELAECLLSLRPTMLLVGVNLKYDLIVLHHHGVDLRKWPWQDTVILDHLVNENVRHSLAACMERYFNIKNIKDFWEEYDYYTQAPEEVRYEYGALDIVYTDMLYEKLLKKYENDRPK